MRRLTAVTLANHHVEQSARVDASMIDPDAWLAWGRDHLTASEFTRLSRAIARDRAEQTSATA